MQHTYKILPEHRLHIETMEGEFTLAGLATTAKAMFADPRFEPKYESIADFRKAYAKMTRVEILAFSGLMRETGMFDGESKWALVASDPLVLELSEVFKNRLNDDDNMRVFTTVKAAAEFIGNPEILNHLNDD